MNDHAMIRLAIQKSGRLHDKSVALLAKAGIELDAGRNALIARSRDFPLEVMLVRDDDIPEYVHDAVCQLGIVGENMLVERLFSRPDAPTPTVNVVMPLGFGPCRLSIAAAKGGAIARLEDLRGHAIATSYPNTLRKHLRARGVDAKVVELAGSVEIAPTIGIAEAICDLVSSGSTLASNNLREVEVLEQSQAVLVQTGHPLTSAQQDIIRRLARRVQGVLEASRSKYIMMNAPASAVARIRDILPGMEAPTVLPLAGSGNRVAIHAVAGEDVFWDTMEALEAAGAESVLVVPIEKIIR